MAKKFARIIIAIAGALIGLAATAGADKLLAMMNRLPLHEAVYIAAAIIFAIIFYILSPRIISGFSKAVGAAEARMSDMSLSDIFLGAVGLIVGLVIGKSPLAHRHDYKRCALLRVRLSWLRAGIEAQGRGQSAFVVPPPGQGEQILFRRTAKGA